MFFVRCPSCQATVWEDLHSIVDGIPTRFRCLRCSHIITLGKCSQCNTRNWKRLSDIFEKDGKKPVVRFECEQCKRVIGILLD